MRKNGRKWISGMLLAVCLTASACGGSEAKEVNVQEMAEKVEAAAEFPDTMVAVEEAMLEKLYGLDPDLFETYYGVTSGGATSDELLILKLKEEKDTDAVKEVLETRLSDRAESFESYAPEEAKKAEDGILKVTGDTVIYCICPNASAAEKAMK